MTKALLRGSLVCPVCKCSLQRLALMRGVVLRIRDIENSFPSIMLGDQRYFFCCPECRDMFLEDPVRYIKEYQEVVVCPVCLAERTRDRARRILYEGFEIYFCGCPHCEETFMKDPRRFVEELDK